MKKVRDVMNVNLETTSPTATVMAAADKMRTLDLTVLPVYQDHKILGVLTDREMTVHIAALRRDPGTTLVKEIMNPHVAVIDDQASLRSAERLMEAKGAHWVFVTDREGALVGMVSLGKVAREDTERAAGKVVRKISQSRKHVGWLR